MSRKPTAVSRSLAGIFLAIGIAGQAQATPVVYTSDFIADGDRSHFNGFESIPNDGVHFTGGSGPYTEDTISVRQVNGDPGNDIWVTSNFWSGFQGSRGWYPDGGDSGYTEITLAGGGDFQSVGFNYGSGFSFSNSILYELLDNGVVVLSGSAILTSCSGCGGPINYLGFSGAGFDTILLRDTGQGGGSVTDGTFQALAIDSIETQDVPEPGTLALLGTGLVGLAGFRRRRKAKP